MNNLRIINTYKYMYVVQYRLLIHFLSHKVLRDI